MAQTSKLAYSPEQVEVMEKRYTDNPCDEVVQELAAQFGKSVKSIVARLARSGIYKPKQYVTKAGTSPVSKEELATKLQELCGMSDSEGDSLAKANKSALLKLIAKLEA